MALLDSVLKNSYLRVSIPAGPIDADKLSQLQQEFLERFQSTRCPEAVVVDVPSIHQPATGLIRLLSTWQRVTMRAGRRFRINGVSRVIVDVQRQLSLDAGSAKPTGESV